MTYRLWRPEFGAASRFGYNRTHTLARWIAPP